MVALEHLAPLIAERWPTGVALDLAPDARRAELRCAPALLAELCGWLVEELDYAFAALIVEQQAEDWLLRYVFHGSEPRAGWVHVLLRRPLAERSFPSISARVHAADWHEREAEDLFGLHFEGHPRLGDFVLHDDAWQEGLAPMRR